MDAKYKSALAASVMFGCVLVPNEEHYAAKDESSETSGEVGETGPGPECATDEDCGADEGCYEGTCVPALPPDLGLPPDELCNGLDDDEDDEIDEDYPELGDPCMVGAGACEAEGVLVCSDDEIETVCDAEPGEPVAEMCNGIDDDCDGIIDQGVLNMCGECGPDPAELCNGNDDDCDGQVDEGFGMLATECSVGSGLCTANGSWICTGDGLGVECDASPGMPAPEVCNGEDDDCNGETDEGVTNSCGECGPDPIELCNGQDEDCDGLVDEDFVELGDLCSEGVGACLTNGVRVCSNNGMATTCNAIPNPPGVESCNGVDDDCDGQVDENVTNACGECGPAPAEVCDGQDNDCDGLVDENVTNVCGECGPVPTEVCDGEDNDCDGLVDENVKNDCGGCGPEPAEVCDDLDNDCDGLVDEGLQCPFEDDFVPAPLLELCPTHTGGNKEFNGNGPEVTASVSLYHTNSQVRADVDMIFIETVWDWSKGEIHSDFLLWTAPNGCTILDIVTPTLATGEYTDTDHSADVIQPAPQNGPVDHFEFVGDTPGDDLPAVVPDNCAGKAWGSVYFQSIVIELTCQ